jgi:hypothetical protein
MQSCSKSPASASPYDRDRQVLAEARGTGEGDAVQEIEQGAALPLKLVISDVIRTTISIRLVLAPLSIGASIVPEDQLVSSTRLKDGDLK